MNQNTVTYSPSNQVWHLDQTVNSRIKKKKLSLAQFQ